MKVQIKKIRPQPVERLRKNENDDEERPRCVLSMKVLAPECIFPNKLKRHLENGW